MRLIYYINVESFCCVADRGRVAEGWNKMGLLKMEQIEYCGVSPNQALEALYETTYSRGRSR